MGERTIHSLYGLSLATSNACNIRKVSASSWSWFINSSDIVGMLVSVIFALVIENLIPSCGIVVLVCIVCIGVSTPPSKILLPSFLPSPPLNLQTVQAPLFRQSPPYILVFRAHPPPKNQIFQLTPKTLKLFILNPILSFKSN